MRAYALCVHVCACVPLHENQQPDVECLPRLLPILFFLTFMFFCVLLCIHLGVLSPDFLRQAWGSSYLGQQLAPVLISCHPPLLITFPVEFRLAVLESHKPSPQNQP